MLIPELMQTIFEGKRDRLAADFDSWVKGSRRFKVFAETYKEKIRKKHRIAISDGSGEMLKDLHCELQVAFRLLGDSRFGVEYETYAASKVRGPDYTVRFRTNTLVNVEVTRVREQAADALPTKLINTICDKVGQMPPNVVNVLVVMSDLGIQEDDVNQAMVMLRALAERKEDPYFTRKGFKNAVDFLRQFQQMSAILVVRQPNVLWLNPLAKHVLPKEIANALRRI